MDELEEKLISVDRNYKHYRDGWVFSVSRKSDLVIISATNKTRKLGLRGGSEIYKRLYLYKSDEIPGTFRASYKYSISDNIFLWFSLFILRIPCPVAVLWSVYLTVASDELSFFGSLTAIGVSSMGTIIGYQWGKGRRKLERDRYAIIREVLTKNGIDFVLDNDVEKSKK